MAYNTPELQLVGAAQNLVLAGSEGPFITEKGQVKDGCGADEANNPGVYNLVPNW